MERFIDIKSWFKAVADYFLPGDCYDEMAVKLNFSNRECFSLLLSRVLSVFITAGSSLMLLAQIMKIYSTGIQIVENYKQRGTGELSLVTVGLQFVGCIARTFIIFRRWGTAWLYLLPSLVTMLLNGLILAQILYYGYDKNARKRAWRERKIEKARKKKKKNL